MCGETVPSLPRREQTFTHPRTPHARTKTVFMVPPQIKDLPAEIYGAAAQAGGKGVPVFERMLAWQTERDNQVRNLEKELRWGQAQRGVLHVCVGGCWG